MDTDAHELTVISKARYSGRVVCSVINQKRQSKAAALASRRRNSQCPAIFRSGGHGMTRPTTPGYGSLFVSIRGSILQNHDNSFRPQL